MRQLNVSPGDSRNQKKTIKRHKKKFGTHYFIVPPKSLLACSRLGRRAFSRAFLSRARGAHPATMMMLAAG